MTDILNKRRNKMKRLGIALIIVIGIVLLIVFRAGNKNKITVPTTPTEQNDSVSRETGWTTEQFIEWAKEVQPVKEHKRWRIWKDGRKELMEPNEPFLVAILNDVNDVPWMDRYKYEWGFELPDELPDPVVKVIESISFADVNDILGKDVDEIIPYLEEPIIEICAIQDEHLLPVSSEGIAVRLSSLSNDRRRFNLETEPFILSDNPDIHGKIAERVVLYTPRNCKVNIRRPQKKRGEL